MDFGIAFKKRQFPDAIRESTSRRAGGGVEASRAAEEASWKVGVSLRATDSKSRAVVLRTCFLTFSRGAEKNRVFFIAIPVGRAA